MKCATHPNVETNLRCSKCGKPICPKCMVQTPVGARCRECARMNRLPTFNVPFVYYIRAIGAGIGIGLVCGALWGLIDWFIPIFSFNLILAPLCGYAISEIISIAVNRKRGTALGIIAGICVLISYGVSLIFPGGIPFGIFTILYHILAIAVGFYVAFNRMR